MNINFYPRTWASGRVFVNLPVLASVGGQPHSLSAYGPSLGPLGRLNSLRGAASRKKFDRFCSALLWLVVAFAVFESGQVSARPPQDGLTQLATADEGSSGPTTRSSQHRLAITLRSRVLAVYGFHKEGVQFGWRDMMSGWETATRGDVTDGRLIGGTGTGDWTASLARKGMDAVAVYSGQQLSSPLRPVYIRRLTELDHRKGPRVDAESIVVGDPETDANYLNVDVAFEGVGENSSRGWITWVRRDVDETGEETYDVEATWFTLPPSGLPIIGDEVVPFVEGLSNGNRSATLVPHESGMRLLVRDTEGNLAMYSRDKEDPPAADWTFGGSVDMGNGFYPSAVALDNGDVLATVETASDEVTIFRFSPDGNAVAEEVLADYRFPALTSDGVDAWLVMIASDGSVVSRKFVTGIGTGPDVLRIESVLDNPNAYRWPNTLRSITPGGRIRFLLEGPAADNPNTSSVFAFQGQLED